MYEYKSQDNLYKVGQRLQDLRNKKDMSQLELSQILKVPRTTVAKWENGNQDLKGDQIVKLSKILGVSTDYLLLGTSPEIFDIHKTTGLSDGAVYKLYRRKGFEDDFYDGHFGVIDLLNEMLSDDGIYTLINSFIKFRENWSIIKSEIQELEKVTEEENQYKAKKVAQEKIFELQDKSDYLMWKHTRDIDTYMQKLLECKLNPPLTPVDIEDGQRDVWSEARQ